MPKSIDELKLNFINTADQLLERANAGTVVDVYALMTIMGEMLGFDYPEEVAYTEIPARWELRSDGSYAALTGESGEEIQPAAFPFVAFMSLFEGADPEDPTEYLRDLVAKEEGLLELLRRFEEFQQTGPLPREKPQIIPAFTAGERLAALISSPKA